jgi:hypothetical protein
MRKFNFSHLALGTGIGIIAGIGGTLAIHAMSGTFSSPTISVSKANSFYKSALTMPVKHCDTVKAMNINMEQYQAMNYISGKVTGLTGFRVYYGIDASGAPVAMVVGVTNTKDNVSQIVQTSMNESGLCPTNCDGASQITVH